MAAVPTPTPVALPEVSTVASDGSLLFQTTAFPVSWSPLAFFATAVYCMAWPTTLAAAEGLTTTVATRLGSVDRNEYGDRLASLPPQVTSQGRTKAPTSTWATCLSERGRNRIWRVLISSRRVRYGQPRTDFLTVPHRVVLRSELTEKLRSAEPHLAWIRSHVLLRV